MPNHLRKLQSNKVQWEKVFSLRNLTFHTFNTYAKRRVGYFFIERKTLIKLNDIALFEIGQDFITHRFGNDSMLQKWSFEIVERVERKI